jgi:hypothetical protein
MVRKNGIQASVVGVRQVVLSAAVSHSRIPALQFIAFTSATSFSMLFFASPKSISVLGL